MQVYDALQHLLQISFNCLFYLYVSDRTVSSLSHSNSGDSCARAAIKMFWLKFLHRRRSRDLSQFKSRWFRRRLPTSCKSLSKAVGNVVHGRPRQPATSADAKYWSIASCAGVSRGMRRTCPNRLHRALMANKLSGLHAYYR